jgi:glycosyltransferase involved in cell wall biosynthesis
MYSGGQYHAFALGKALASRGHFVDFYWNHPPIFSSEFPHIETHDSNLDDFNLKDHKNYNYVVVAPSGFYVPAYYETALQLAAVSGARICLLNYESANWFNALAPTPDDPRVWDYWRRVVIYGGLVVSSTREADYYARTFYNTPHSKLSFEVSSPPTNSDQASRILSRKIPKDGSIIIFVRRSHDYKGGEDLLKLSPELFSGRSLHIVFGGQQDDAFLKELQAHYHDHHVTIRAHSHISAEEKYTLLAKAQVLLFPSSFEGFGYPPLEAFSVGTEVVCYDLPVLKETLTDLAFFAPLNKIPQLEEKISSALSTHRDTSVLMNRADEICGFNKVGVRFEALLEKHLSILPPLYSYSPCLHWGPFDKDQAVTIPPALFQVAYPPFVEKSVSSNNGRIIDVRLATNQPIHRVEVEGTSIECLSIDEVQYKYHQSSDLHYVLRLLGKRVGPDLLHFRLNDASTYTEIIRIVSLTGGR